MSPNGHAERRGTWAPWPTSTSSPCTGSGGSPAGPVVLDNISLSFLPGRQDRRARRERGGQKHAAADHGRDRRGLLRRRDAGAGGDGRAAEQEPALDEAKDVRGNVEEGVAEQGRAPARFEELGARLGELDPDAMEAPSSSTASCRSEIDRLDAWDLDSKLEVAMDALRVPPDDQDVIAPSRAASPPRGPLPPAAAGARRAAARRAHQPPRRRVGGVAGAAPRGVRRHGRRRHARPLLPRQRRRLDPRAGPRRASRGRATTRRGWSRSAAPGARGEDE